MLFAATCATTFFAGGLGGEEQIVFLPGDGLLYAASIMGILLIHEMGHFLAARRHRVDASLPYFIPAPFPPIGTFGAVIRMRTPPRTRVSLLDIGAAGPLAGMVVAVVVCFVGLELSEVRPLAALPEHAILEGNSLVYLALKKLAHPGLGPGDDVFLHPVAWAGWLGLLVTSLNLLPAGQLDGGHILYALAGPARHRRVARAVHLAVFGMGIAGLACQMMLLHGPTTSALEEAGLLGVVLRGTGMIVWLVWAVLLYFVGGEHPPVENQAEFDQPLPRARRVAGVVSLLVLVITFTPVVWSPVSP